MSPIRRREFLKRAAAAVAAPYALTSTALGAVGRPPASERIVMGAIGVGNMGSGDMNAFLHAGRVQMVAVCDVDGQRRDRAKARVDEHYGHPSCAAYTDFRKLLARGDLDAVTIGTPDHWHAIPVIEAAKAGLDMYCQKPLSLTVAEGRAMADAVHRYGRVFQTGSQQRSGGQFRFACELVRNGRIGKVHTVKVGLPTGPTGGTMARQDPPAHLAYDMWLGPAPWAPYTPDRCHYSFRWIYDYSGGQVTDWGAHHIDIAQWGLGYERSGPVRIEPKQVNFAPGPLYNTPVNFRFVCTYASGVRVIVSNALHRGVRFEGDQGAVFVNRGGMHAEPATLQRGPIRPGEVHLYRSGSHRGNFLDGVRTRRETVAPIEIAHRSVTTCHLGNIAMRLGRAIRWDPTTERILGDAEAARMLMRAKRPPWRT